MVWNIQRIGMECHQVHSALLPHNHPLTLMILSPVDVKIELWVDVMLLWNFLPLPFVSTTLFPCYCWRDQCVCSGYFWCQRFLPPQSMPEAFLPFPDRLYPIPTLGLLELPAWPAISAVIPSVNLLVLVHPFLLSNRLQHPLRMHLPSP